MPDFQCGVCKGGFSSLASCVDHIYTHRSSQYSCVVPGCWYTAARLTQHLKGSHSKLCEYPCGACRRVFVRETDLKNHSNALHGGFVSHPKQVHNYGGETSNHLVFGWEFYLNQSSSAQLSNTEIDFNKPASASDLNTFIDDHLQPTMEFNNEMNKTVDNICSFLQEHFKPREIVKGGSLGKGTAVKGMSDIDLVLVLNEITDADDLREKLDGTKNNIIEKLRSSSIGIVGCISQTRFAVKFTVKGIHGNIDVDLLPTFHFDDLKRLYNKMKSDSRNIDYYSAALVKYQVDFVKSYPANLKNLIRLVKYWKKQMVTATGSQRIPTSYVMELITIDLWEDHSDEYGRFNTLKALHGVMTALVNYESLYVIWQKNYDDEVVPLDIRGKRPLVMDPANPTNNVCSKFDWDEIIKAAKKVLDGPMMRSVKSADTWA